MNKMIKPLLVCLLCVVGRTVQAQDQPATPTKASLTGFVGTTTPILDDGWGVSVGVNPAYSFSDWLALEGRVSYQYNQITGAFLSGDTGQGSDVNLLVGGRLYLTKPDKPTRIYLNALAGVNYNREQMVGEALRQEWAPGLMGGAYLSYKAYRAGVVFESKQNVGLLLGYQFGRR